YDTADQMASDLRAVAERRMPMAAINYTGDQEVGQPSPDTESTTVFPQAGAAAAGAGLAGAAGAAAGPRASGTTAAPAVPADGASAPRASGPVEGDDSGNRKRKRRASTIAWIVALVALLGVGGVVAYNLVSGDDLGSSETQVSVPDVRDRPQAEAEQILEDAGFSVQVEEAADTDIERGNAIRTDPGTDSSVPEGSRITLFVSSGKEITEVPDLTGMNTEQAQRALSDVGLKLKSQVEEEPSDSVEAGKITSQSPGQGSQVSKGTEVAITVSTGAEKVRVPTVSGQQLDAARDNLEGAGFTVNVQMVDSTEPENQVLSASDEGTQQPKGSTITITVSRGNQFTMPNLQNRNIDEVEGLLKDAGWTGSSIQRDTVNTIDPLAIDRVVGQNDSPGSTVSKDATITVRVNVLGLPSRL
ncbi:MAG: PASTA domain-containing protein, partial [Corynebacterium variabile]